MYEQVACWFPISNSYLSSLMAKTVHFTNQKLTIKRNKTTTQQERFQPSEEPVFFKGLLFLHIVMGHLVFNSHDLHGQALLFYSDHEGSWAATVGRRAPHQGRVFGMMQTVFASDPNTELLNHVLFCFVFSLC